MQVYPVSRSSHFSFKEHFNHAGVQLSYTTKKVVQFVKKHRLAVAVYTMATGVMFACRVSKNHLATAIIPGFLFTIFMTPGLEVPEELITRSFKKARAKVFIPTSEEQSDSLKKRKEMSEAILQKISPKKSKKWSSHKGRDIHPCPNIFLSGPTGCGKSAYLTWLSERLEGLGHEVYLLSTDKWASVGSQYRFFNGDPRSFLLRNYLNYRSKVSKLPAVLIIDDGEKFISPEGTGSIGEGIKDGLSVKANKFVTILSMVKSPDQLDQSWAEILRRFDGNCFDMEALDKEGVIKTLNEIKKERIEDLYKVKLSEKVVTHTVNKVIEKTLNKENLWIDRVLHVLQESSNHLRLEAGPSEEDIFVTIDHIENMFNSMKWL